MICQTAVSLVLVVLAIGGHSGAPVDQQLAIDMTTKNGNQIQVPFFSPELTSVEPELKDYLVNYTEEMVNLVGETVIGRLTAKRSPFGALQGGLAWTKLAGQVAMVAHSQESKQPESNKKIAGTRSAYSKAMNVMFRRLQAASKTIDVRRTPKDPIALSKDVRMFIEDFIEIIRASPVSSYVDWSRGTINGEPLEATIAELLAKLSHNGYGAVFGALEMLVNLQMQLSGSK